MEPSAREYKRAPTKKGPIMGQGQGMSATASHPDKKNPIPERMLTLPQSAQFLAISESTMRRYLKAGKIPFRKVGEMYRFDLADLQAFAQKFSA